jgi:hypothetical protein
VNFTSSFYGGQVPQIGLGNTQDVAFKSKDPGNDGINVTHQEDKS